MSPPQGRGSRADWRVNKRFTPRVVTCPFQRALIAVEFFRLRTLVGADVPMLSRGRGLFWGGNIWMR
jgi:hypothetical protein